ncbi:NAD(P)/FAD-dependent oxidoreductase [Mycolicibacterium sp. P9-22]|uniref:NAD(P)/FAD-dependent oxidoreductase n=1 Tax=Mycolicibacterium sp. P9-22 TaxID=2024613 RepID=UPI001D1372EC|nr:FAD-dependent oxidoreductase [Mycolicibacterium sp. P9-22]
MIERLVIVGASLGGLRAAEAARKAGHTGSIALVGGERHVPYDRPPLSKAYLENDEPEMQGFRSEDQLRGELALDLRLSTWATRLDTDRKVVTLRSGEKVDEIDYDALIIATGATARTLPDAGELAGVHTLRTLDDAIAIRRALKTGRRAVVVGAGFIGSEVASSARKRGLDVTVLEALPVPLVRSVGEEMGMACADLHRRNGTNLRCGVKVVGLESADGHVTGVALDDGSTVPADVVVVGAGATPATEWLAGSGVTLHERDGGILCDEYLHTSAENVYAIGDVAHFPNPLFENMMMRLEHWSNASEHGVLAATNALALGHAKSATTVPYFWSDWYSNKIQFVGIPHADEIRVISKELGEDNFLALYRRGDRITGCISIDRPREIMKFRRLIAQTNSWSDGLKLAGVS